MVEISYPHTQEESQVGREDVHSGLVDPQTGLTAPDEVDPQTGLTTPDRSGPSNRTDES